MLVLGSQASGTNVGFLHNAPYFNESPLYIGAPAGSSTPF